jgi:glucose-6-phosphate isomerase
MLTRNIDFKNFKINKNTQKVKNKLKKLLQENNEVIKSLKKTYKNSYKRKLVNKYNKDLNYRVIGMGGSTLGTQAIYDFLRKKIKKNFSFVDNLKTSE